MTLSEFKAFLDGMDVAVGDCPTISQWERIKAKIEMLDTFMTINPIVLPDYPGTPVPDYYPGWTPNTSVPFTTCDVDADSVKFADIFSQYKYSAT